VLGWLRSLMLDGLEYFFTLTNNYGYAIILLTVTIRTVLLPFTVLQTRSTLKMQELNPKVEALKKKYKNDAAKLNQEIMELWKKNKVNPMSGCLLMLIQFPFLIAFFQALNNYTYHGPASFLWIEHLGKPDSLYVLPVLAALTTYWQSKISMPTGGEGESQQTVMLYGMPIFILMFSVRFAAGLSLYWVVSNIYGIVQQYLMPKRKITKEEAA
jgi:YidC/Oxa1 family membrane protein insertase